MLRNDNHFARVRRFLTAKTAKAVSRKGIGDKIGPESEPTGEFSRRNPPSGSLAELLAQGAFVGYVNATSKSFL